jgi:hypothetical protein
VFSTPKVHKDFCQTCRAKILALAEPKPLKAD